MIFNKYIQILVVLLFTLNLASGRYVECYQNCRNRFQCDPTNNNSDVCRERLNYCPPTCTDLEDPRLIAECEGECMFNQRRKNVDIKKFLKCIDLCETEIQPQYMSEKELVEFKEQLKEDPLLHPGSTLKRLNCDPSKRKKAVIQKSHTGSQVLDYFLSRCDYYVIQPKPSLKYYNFDFKWTTYRKSQYYSKFDSDNQIINHIQNIKELIGYKDDLVKTLKAYDSYDYYTFSSKDFHFPSYHFNINTQEYSEEELFFFKNVNEGFWITKQPKASLGNGITLYNNVQTIKNNIVQIKKNKGKGYEEEDRITQYSLVQKYLHNPLLVNGKKNDMRNYILVASLEPLVILYQNGFIRTCIEDYDDNNFTQFDQETAYRHLTNRSFQEKHPEYDMLKHKLLLLPSEFEDAVMKEKGVTREFIQKKLYDEVKRITLYTILAAEEKMFKDKGIFQFLGGDFIFDDDFNTYLIEVNMSAGFFNNLKAHKLIVPEMVQTGLDLVLETLEDPTETRKFWENPENLELGKWEILYNEATGYNYLDQFKKEGAEERIKQRKEEIQKEKDLAKLQKKQNQENGEQVDGNSGDNDEADAEEDREQDENEQHEYDQHEQQKQEDL